MSRERNDLHEYEEAFQQPKAQPDPDDESDEFHCSLAEDLSAQRRNEIALSATPEQFRDMWAKL